MRKFLTITVLAGALVGAGCTMSSQERQIAGGVIGAGAGVLTAQALGANTNWSILAGLTGAVAGTMVARNTQTNECAYARGDGTYYTRRC